MAPRLLLSNYGIRFLHHEAAARSVDEIAADPVLGAMAALWRQGASQLCEATSDRLIDAGLAADAADLDPQAIRLRYQRNPLEHIRRVVFEYTRQCNFRCLHCRNDGVRDSPARRGPVLFEAVDAMAAIGVLRFDFIGGEVTRFGDGWLDIVERIRRIPGATSAVITNGWFLEQRDFRAAGETFDDDEAYLRHLYDRGLTHVIFSIDGPASLHDTWRRCPGLYDRIVRGFDRVRAVGLIPRLSVVVRSGDTQWLSPLATAIYGESREAEQRLMADDFNYVSNFIDVGAGASMSQAGRPVALIPDEALRCKNFFRPSPSLRIQANGEVALCPLLDAGEGFGNIHDRGVLPVLNGLQDAFVYRLHAERRIARYRHLLDGWFGDRVVHVCSMRAALTLIARELEARGISPHDAQAVPPVVEGVARRIRSQMRRA